MVDSKDSWLAETEMRRMRSEIRRKGGQVNGGPAISANTGAAPEAIRTVF
jgi:hypothetical protein